MAYCSISLLVRSWVSGITMVTAVTASPTEEELTLIRGPVRADLAETYPRFAAAL